MKKMLYSFVLLMSFGLVVSCSNHGGGDVVLKTTETVIKVETELNDADLGVIINCFLQDLRTRNARGELGRSGDSHYFDCEGIVYEYVPKKEGSVLEVNIFKDNELIIRMVGVK